jgi:hypothetical protein
MSPAHLRAEDIPDSPPFPHPVCFKLLVGSTVAGPIADAINFESCTAWADIMPAADWNYENKTHSYYSNDNSDGLPGGYAGYTVGGWNPDGAYVIRTFDTGGGNGFHTAFLVAAEELGILATVHTRKFGDRCNGQLEYGWANEDGTYGVEVAATPQAIFNAANLGADVTGLVFDDYVLDCPSCCVGQLRASVDPDTDALT